MGAAALELDATIGDVGANGVKNITAEVLLGMKSNSDHQSAEAISLPDVSTKPAKSAVVADVRPVTDGPVDALPLPPRANKKPRAPADNAETKGNAAATGDASGGTVKTKGGKNGGNERSPNAEGDGTPAVATDKPVDAASKPAVKGKTNPNPNRPNNKSNKASNRPKAAPEGVASELEELPKRQLWIVRVPKPAEAEHTAEDVTAMEEKMVALSAKIDKAMKVIAVKQEERNAARSNLATVRDRMRDVAGDIREKFAQAKPLQDRVNAIVADATEVKDMSRELKVTTEDALDATLERLEYQMSHESLSVLQQKAILRQVKILKGTRAEIQDLHGKREAVAGARGEKDECYSQLKLVRGEIDILKQQEAVQKKIFDHYKSTADAADADVKRENEARGESNKERGKISADLRGMRSTGNRDKSEFWRARRTVGKARDLVKVGNIAEAEALCLEQMEHMHARLNMSGAYRREYLEAMGRMNEERAAARNRAKEEAQREVEEAAKSARAKIAEEAAARKEQDRMASLEAKEAEKGAKTAAKEADRAAAAAAKEKLAEDKRAAAAAEEAKKAAVAKTRAENQANAQGRKPSAMPDLGPSKTMAAMAEAEALHRGHVTPEAVAAHKVAAAAAAASLQSGETDEEQMKRVARERALAGVREAEDRKRRMAERKAQRAGGVRRAAAAEEAQAAAHAEKEDVRAAAEATSRTARAADAALVAASKGDDAAAGASETAVGKRKKPTAMSKKRSSKWWQSEQFGYFAIAISVILLFLLCLAAMLQGKK